MMRRTVTRAAAKSALLLAVNITAGSAIAAPGHDTAAQQAEAHEAAGKAMHEWGEKSVPQFEPKYQAQFRAPLVSTGYEFETSTLADGLVHPWSIEELPDGQGYLVTEREGRLRLVKKDGSVSHPIKGVPKVENRKPDSSWPTQAGLLDVKLGPSFAKDRHVYLTYSKPVGDDQSVTAAARGKLNADLTALEDVQDIFVQSPPSKTRMHYGSRIIFDDHGHLFITTGEHSSLKTRGFAQHLDKTYGKVVRLNLDGTVPPDNPFVGVEDADDQIWSYGHRNIQGAAVKHGMLFTLEHGPKGGDELNMPLPARNYGWPVVSYGRRYEGPLIGSGKPRMPGMAEPFYYWDPVIGPGDLAFYQGQQFSKWQGDMLIGALVAPGIVRLRLNGPLVTQEERILTNIGRVRDIEVAGDGSLLLAIDEQDGKIVQVNAAGSTNQ